MRAEGDEELSGKWTSFRRTSGKQHKVAPKKQPITKFRVIFQVKMTERRTMIYLFCAFFVTRNLYACHFDVR